MVRPVLEEGLDSDLILDFKMVLRLRYCPMTFCRGRKEKIVMNQMKRQASYREQRS